MNITVITSDKTASRRVQIEGLVEQIRQEIPGKVDYVTEFDAGDDQAVFVKDHVDLSRVEDGATGSEMNRYLRSLHPTQVSNLRKHVEALRRASYSEKPSLILEDDAIAGDDFLTRLKACLTGDAAPAGWDVIVLGLPGKEAGFHRLEEQFRVLPVCDSYLVTPGGAKKVSEAFLPAKFITNIQLSYVFAKAGVEAYMITPNVFVDSSTYGVYASTVSPNNPLILNRQYVEARAAIRSDDAEFEAKRDALEQTLVSGQFRSHPDFMHLRALFERRRNGAAAAEAVFQEALKMYDSCNAILNNESEFLKDYIALYADLQDAADAATVTP
jgi:GR25 family glycosyltransferase involved in LPS biosynthesis